MGIWHWIVFDREVGSEPDSRFLRRQYCDADPRRCGAGTDAGTDPVHSVHRCGMAGADVPRQSGRQSEQFAHL